MSGSSPASVQNRPGAFIQLLKRLHFYIGLFVGPFLLVAALSGIVYALTPQLEDYLYADALHTDSQGAPLSLAAQVRAAQAAVDPSSRITAVRPSPAAGDTTRVMFNAPGLGASESRAIFIDPVTGEVKGDMKVYGTSGVLPLRTWLDQFHRGLLLGDVGRIYSELAASWLWVATLGGLVLWASRRSRTRGKTPAGLRSLHGSTGVWLLAGLLFFSATGLTWSQYAGSNIGILRAYYGWSTPVVSTEQGSSTTMKMPMDEHAEHHMHMDNMPKMEAVDPDVFDQVMAAARTQHIDAAKVEIKPAMQPGKAWTVNEIDRRWPTHVDAVAIDPGSLAVVDHVLFAQYSLPAKLTRWGIDAHMGVLFGLANQLLLIGFAGGLVVMVVWGYLLWWRRRPTFNDVPQPSLINAWRELGLVQRILTIVISTVLGICLPVLGASLLVFLAVDFILGFKASFSGLKQRQL
ncbi:PepSY-associated TM helix domain-containing protein [Pseudomonas sp.]|uniref:PepSY-associated TM helix domain-containing protein n=1 Tax=Pseudomonas sp. TaxID=306 RepID=UPI0028AA4039|nr:PepSY-associated TM helix domain-containing protein [Pseudomonas sp.]